MGYAKKAQEAYDMVNKYFKGSATKTFIWFNTLNPSLGSVKPIDMIRNGRIDKLLKFIKSQLSENLR